MTMYSKFKSLIAGTGAMVLAIGLTAGGATASTITRGTLTSDSLSGTILDTVNGTEYTRLDAFDWTVAQVKAAIQTGGAYDGWSILNATQADIFVNSILGVSSTVCSTNGATRAQCGQITNWSDGDFGTSHKSVYDFVAYLDDDSASDVGFLKINGSNGNIHQMPDRETFTMLDTKSSGNAINLMLYKAGDLASIAPDLAAVPLPASGMMLAGALAGFGLMRRRRKAA